MMTSLRFCCRARGATAALVVVLLFARAGDAAEGISPEQTRYPRRARCGMNLAEVGRYVQTCALAHNGLLPARLADAFRGVDDGGVACLVCPAEKAALAEGGFFPSYAWAQVVPGGRRLEDSGGEFLAFDPAPVHEGGRNVLFWDAAENCMKVNYIEEADFQRRWAEQQAKYQRAGQTLRIVAEDFLPLNAHQRRLLEGRSRSFWLSTHFYIAVVLVIAIAAVLVILELRTRRGRPAR